MTLRAGFIGLGSIGKPMACRLAKGGLETTVLDLVDAATRELAADGAKIARSPRCGEASRPRLAADGARARAPQRR